MGQKVCPIGLRLGITETWRSNWYADKRQFGEFLVEDQKIRKLIKKEHYAGGISKIEIMRPEVEEVDVIIHAARPGIVIGERGSRLDSLRVMLEKMTNRRFNMTVKEVGRAELDAQLTAESIAQQILKRASYRRALKRAVEAAMQAGAEGIRVAVAGRLGGAEMSRREGYTEGRVPLHTLRAKIDYGFAEAHTIAGAIGIKVWINHGLASSEE